MNLRTRLRRDCRLAHVDAYMNDPERFDEAADFAHDFYRDNPEATKEDCELAGKRAGLDPVTISILCSLAYLAWEVFKAWRARGKTVEEPHDYETLIQPRDGYNDNALRPY